MEEGERLLTEQPNGDCIFFVEGRCSIHAVKPTQCRLYPFWFRNVRSEQAWQRTCRECPGIGEGEWVSPEEIERQVAEDLESGARTSVRT
jgi:Fe-S-cluster containining protein